MVLTTIKTIVTTLFPLITFPYVTRILGVDNIGRYNFASSVISYFLLLAGLGISSYAVREGAPLREDKEQFEQFTSEMFSINMISTAVSYVLLVLLVLWVDKIRSYWLLIAVFSLKIFFQTLGVEWLYTLEENYLYITIRSIVFQVVALLLLLAMVRNQNDTVFYVVATVISEGGSNVLNFIHSRRYCRLRLTGKIDWKKHMRPILVLFGMALTISIYVSSDVTMLGFLCGDREVGLYSVSVKIYTILRGVLAAVIVVSIPRVSFVLGHADQAEFRKLAKDIYGTLLSVTLPAIFGLVLLRRQVLLVVSDQTFLGASTSLMILSFTMLVFEGAYFWGQVILVPLKQESVVFKGTVCSAILNVVLNLILIPLWGANAAALTTFISEGFSFLWCRGYGSKYVQFQGIGREVLKILVGCIGVTATVLLAEQLVENEICFIVVSVVVSVFVYGIVEIKLKNEAVYTLYQQLMKKIRS